MTWVDLGLRHVCTYRGRCILYRSRSCWIRAYAGRDNALFCCCSGYTSESQTVQTKTREAAWASLTLPRPRREYQSSAESWTAANHVVQREMRPEIIHSAVVSRTNPTSLPAAVAVAEIAAGMPGSRVVVPKASWVLSLPVIEEGHRSRKRRQGLPALAEPATNSRSRRSTRGHPAGYLKFRREGSRQPALRQGPWLRRGRRVAVRRRRRPRNRVNSPPADQQRPFVALSGQNFGHPPSCVDSIRMGLSE